MQDKINHLVQKIKKNATGKNTISSAESCTGGMIATSLTKIAGASQYFINGFVTYSTEAKIRILNVDKTIIDRYGVISEETAHAMAKNCLKISKTDLSIATTGITGPGGSNESIPVGTVCFALASQKNVWSYKHFFTGSREIIRCKSTIYALELINDWFN